MNQPNHSHTKTSTIELAAVLVAVTDFHARVLTVLNGNALPFGPLSVLQRSLQAGVREWVATQTAQPMGYVEQLYTFVDTSRRNSYGDPVVYVTYLGLVSEAHEGTLTSDAKWRDWYEILPWEDVRNGTPAWVQQQLLPQLMAWTQQTANKEAQQARQNRVHLCWGLPPFSWSEEPALLRYELLYECGLIAESPQPQANFAQSLTGEPMFSDHRHVLATALSRLRGKIKYRPVIFELMPPEFTLLQLQKSVEALAVRELHKPNFRRLIQYQDLIEPMGTSLVQDRGRPAQLYRFRDDVMMENLISGIKLPIHKDN